MKYQPFSRTLIATGLEYIHANMGGQMLGGDHHAIFARHRDLHSFPTRRSSDLPQRNGVFITELVGRRTAAKKPMLYFAP